MNLFEGYPQFITWVPRPKPDGKTDKIPVDVNGRAINPLDSKNWMSETTAREKAVIGGLGIGFVFTREDPFFFVDIDSRNFPNGVWSETARQIFSAFPGCAVEMSYSGKGAHIFGKGRVTGGTHRNRNKVYDLELYTADRFVALTGTSLSGDTGTDGSAGLQWLADTYFPQKQATAIAEWTDTPCREWRGHTDDGELLKKAKRSRSVNSVFGNSATFAQLFRADAEKLALAFPPNDPTKSPFNHSDADAALCVHLAFWTGKDCGRMERLFSLSELAKRDKWLDRQEYRESTILQAVAICTNVHCRIDPVGEPTEPVSIAPVVRTGVQLMDLHTQLRYFENCVYIVTRHKVFTPEAGLLKPEQFRAVYGGYDFAVQMEGKTVRNAFEAFTETQLFHFPQAFGTCFRPELPPGTVVSEEGRTYLNTYTPAQVEKQKGDVQPFLGLLEKLFPVERDRWILLSYLSACVQFPGKKFQWAPLIQGTEGNGKSFITTALSKAVGERYSHFPKASDLDNKFTGWVEDKLLIVVEDVYTSGKSDLIESLKPLITNPRIEIQGKGKNQMTGDNRANYVLNSNYKEGIPKTHSDRRYCIFYTPQQEASHLKRDGMDGRYFPDLYDWARDRGYAIIADYLSRYDIPEEFNPARYCVRAPETSSTGEAIRISVGGVEQEIMEAVGEERRGFQGGWISSVALDLLLQERKRKVALNKRRRLLENMGYVVKCRMNAPSPLDSNRKPVLYCLPAMRDTTADGIETETAYLEAQGFSKSR